MHATSLETPTFPDLPPTSHLPGLTHRFIQVRGARFHVAELAPDPAQADPDALPVLFLHGLPTHWYLWRHVPGQLAGSRRLICLDLRGCGWSEATRKGYATADQVADVLAVLDEFGADRVHLVGHETGGWLGFLLCFAAPERFEAYLGVNTSHPWLEKRFGVPWSAWRFWYTAFWEYPLIGRRVLRHWPGFTRFLLKYWAGRDQPMDAAALEEYVHSYRSKERSRVLEQNLWQFVLHDIPALARGRFRTVRLSVPTLLLVGTRDPVTVLESASGLPEHADRLEVRAVPGARMLPETSPAVVAAAAREWFGIAGRAESVATAGREPGGA
jgi:pimeloyl-ACP methyl ester carboxylesterase